MRGKMRKFVRAMLRADGHLGIDAGDAWANVFCACHNPEAHVLVLLEPYGYRVECYGRAGTRTSSVDVAVRDVLRRIAWLPLEN